MGAYRRRGSALNVNQELSSIAMISVLSFMLQMQMRLRMRTRMPRLDPDAEELKDTIARVARLVLEREREAGVAKQVRPDVPFLSLPSLGLTCQMCQPDVSCVLPGNVLNSGGSFLCFEFRRWLTVLTDHDVSLTPTGAPLFRLVRLRLENRWLL